MTEKKNIFLVHCKTKRVDSDNFFSSQFFKNFYLFIYLFIYLTKLESSTLRTIVVSCKTSLFSDAFRLTVVNFLREFYKLTPNACINKP